MKELNKKIEEEGNGLSVLKNPQGSKLSISVNQIIVP